MDIKFKRWLINDMRKDTHQTTDILSRVARVEKAFSILWERYVNLEKECQDDECEKIISELCVKQREKMPPEINLPTNTAGLSQLRSAVRMYVQYYKSRT